MTDRSTAGNALEQSQRMWSGTGRPRRPDAARTDTSDSRIGIDEVRDEVEARNVQMTDD